MAFQDEVDTIGEALELFSNLIEKCDDFGLSMWEEKDKLRDAERSLTEIGDAEDEFDLDNLKDEIRALLEQTSKLVNIAEMVDSYAGDVKDALPER